MYIWLLGRVDSGATTHICVFKGYLWSRKPIDAERFIYQGGGQRTIIEAIMIFRLSLKTGYFLDLEKTYVVLSFRHNFYFHFDKSGYSYSFENNKVSLFQDSNILLLVF